MTVVEVTCPNEAALEQLVTGGYMVDNVRGLTAVVYATDAELARIQAAGWGLRVLGQDPLPPAAKTPTGYHNYAELTTTLQGYADAYPDICRLYSLGQSIQGRELWAMLITDHPDVEEDEPEFKYISTIHGDEPIGTELCLAFIERLLSRYATDTYVAGLVDTTAISVLPLMNPDGRELSTRRNASGADLNRSFPAYPNHFTGNIFDGEALHAAGRPIEVQHVMNWTAANSFVLSANFHTGALVVNYPYDDDGGPSGRDAPTPDDLLFEDISLRYSRLNLPMYTSPQFSQGITNGAAWYTIDGGLQDWSYRYASCMDVTIELYNTKWPSGGVIPTLRAQNEASMLAYLEAVHLGVRGIVRARRDQAPLYAKVSVAGNAQPVFTDPDVGDYHRLLLPGQYGLACESHGFIPYHVEGVTVVQGTAVRRDFGLSDGDVDLNGNLDDSDVQAVVRGVMGATPIYEVDVDGRGLSATDIQAVINSALGLPIAAR
jgi:carboxypeptidase D